MQEEEEPSQFYIGTHFVYPNGTTMFDQAELAWVADYIQRGCKCDSNSQALPIPVPIGPM